VRVGCRVRFTWCEIGVRELESDVFGRHGAGVILPLSKMRTW
jgi:hypothetical protein